MATEPEVPSDTDSWNVPTIVEIEAKREQLDLSKREFSKIVGYTCETGYHGAVRQNSMGYEKIRTAVQHFRDAGAVNYRAPTMDEIVGAIERRGIAQTHFSEAIGYSSASAFGNAETNGQMEVTHYRAAVEAIHYYDENGIIPLPYELESLNL